MNFKSLAGTALSLAVVLCSVSVSAQTVTTTYNDAGNGSQTFSPGSWSNDANWSALSPVTLSGEGDTVNVDIGTVPSAASSGDIILDLGGANGTIDNLTFDQAGAGTNGTPGLNATVAIVPSGADTLTVKGNITNNSLFNQDVTPAVLFAGGNGTYAGSAGGAGGQLSIGTLNLKSFTIATTGTVNIADKLLSTISSTTSFGQIGTVTAPDITISISNAGTTYTGNTGDFFQIASGNLAGSSANVSAAPLASGLSWIQTLAGKGILFVEPTAGTTVINSGVVLPIGDDTEFNTGGIVFNGGELLTSNEGAGDSGNVALGTAFSTGRTIAINIGTSATIAATTGTTATYTSTAVISDSAAGTPGPLTIGDAMNTGTVVFAAANTYTGGTSIVSGATLQLANAAAAQNSTVTVNAANGLTFGTGIGTFLLGGLAGSGSEVLADTGSTAVTLQIGNDGASAAYSGVLSGPGALTKLGTGVQTLSGASTYTGATAVNAGTLQAGVASVANTSGAFGNNSAVTVGAGATLDLAGFNTQIGSLTGGGSVTDSGAAATLSTGGDNTNTTYSGTISDGAGAVSLTKIGTGTATLSGANSYSGPTTINAGTLIVSGSTAAAGSVAVNSGGVLSGTGSTGAVTVNSGGKIDLTANSAIGTLTVGNLTVMGGSSLSFAIGSSLGQNDKIAAGSLTIGTGTTTINVSNFGGGGSLASGTYTLLSYTGTAVGNLTSLQLSAPTLDGDPLMLVTSQAGLVQLQVTATASQTFSNPSPNPINIIVNSTTPVSATLTNNNATGGNNIAVNLADAGGTGGPVSGLSPASGTMVTPQTNTTVTGTFTGTTVGTNETWSISNTDTNPATPTTITTGGVANVYNHSAPTLTIAGNNLSAFVNSTLTATATLSNTAGNTPAPLDVTSLSNLTGATGSGVVASGGTGTYTTTAGALSTATVGLGQTVTVGLTAGDQQTVVGAGALNPLSTTVTYNVYNHTTPTLALTSGNNQSVFVGGTLNDATLTLSNPGTTVSPLDVNGLTNLTGASGTGVVAANGTSGYTAALSSATAGIGQTLQVGLNAGDEQAFVGANPLSALSQTITYNVYTHSMPVLTVTSGGSQSVFVGGTLANATLTLSNPGTTVVPLDVNTLTNLTGATGTAVVATGGTGTYTSNTSTLSTATAALNQTQTVSLAAGDEQSITGANALSTLSQTINYNVYTHSAATLSIATGNNQMIITGGTFGAATATLSNPGATVVPLDVNTPVNVTGATGTAVIGTGASGTYAVTVANINNTTVGANQTFAVSLNAGDEQSVPGANPLGTLTQNLTYSVYGHAAPLLSGTTLTLGDVHVGYTAPVTSSDSLTVTNGTAGAFIVNLDGSATSSGGISLTAIPAGSNITAGTTSGPITATLAVGRGLGAFTSQTYTFGDDSTLSGASASVATSAITIAGEVYSGQSVWNTNGSGSWGTLTTGFGANWGANQGSPGLDPGFVASDTATFDNTALTAGTTATVTLDGANPSLTAITFNTTGTGVAAYTIAQGSGGTLTLNNGAGTATITDSSGSDTISAPIQLNSNAVASVANAGDTLTLTGNIAGTGTGLTVSGAGKVVLGGTNTYSGATTVSSGVLDVTSAGALGGGGALNLDSGSTLIGDGQTVANSVSITGNVTLGNTAGAGGLVLSGPVTLASGTDLTVDSATTIAGAISGAGLNLTGPAALTLTGNNSANTAATTVTAGTLAFSSPASLTSGLITLSGGATLDYTGTGASLAQAITVPTGSTGVIDSTGGGVLTLNGDIAKNGSILDFGGGAVVVSGVISGSMASSDLDVTGGSTVALTNMNTYNGPTIISGGSTLLTGVANALPTTTTTDLTLGAAGEAASVTNTLDLLGNSETVNSLSTAGGGTNQIISSNGTATPPVVGAGASATTGSLTVNYSGANVDTFSGSLGGAGAANNFGLVKSGSGTLYLTGASSYTGGTTLSAGTLIAGSATAFGNGALTQAAGTTLKTDNTNHTIGVGGSFVQNGGTLDFNINGVPTAADDGMLASNDIVKVQGAAMLNGTIALTFIGSQSHIYQKGDVFTVVESNLANTSLTGGLTLGSSFTSTVVSPRGFRISASVAVPPTLTDAANDNNLYVTITSTQLELTSIPGAVFTPNQRNIATYIDNNVLDGHLFDLLSTAISNNPLSAPSLVAQYNPEVFANFVRSATFNNTVFSLQELDSYFESQRSAKGDFLAGNGQIDSSGLTVDDPNMDPALAQVGSRLLAWSPAPIGHGMLSDTSDPVIAGVDSKNMESKDMQPAAATGNAFNAFVVGNVVLGQNFSQTDLNHSDTSTGGVQLGADYRLTPHLRAGALFAYNHTDGTIDNNGSSATIDSYAPGAYVSFADKGWYANAVGSYGFDNYTEARRMSVGGSTAIANGAPNGDHVTGDLDGGYDFHVNNCTFGPLAGVEYTHLDVDSYKEDGAEAINSNLAVNTQKGDSLRSRVGGHFSYLYQTGKVLLTPHLDASWQHEFMDQSESLSANLVSFGGTPFSVTTPRPSRESALLDAGLNAELNGQITVFGDYLVQAGQSNYFGQSVQAGVKIGF